MAIYKTRTVYETADGKTFRSDQEADRHGKDLLGAELEKFLTKNLAIQHAPSAFKIASNMIDNPKETARDLRHLLKLIDYGSSQP